MRSVAFFFFLVAVKGLAFSQSYPTYGPEIPVTVAGLTFDAMEPFLSPDGNTLFFNSLNAGGNTNLYQAERVNDTTFTFGGLVNGTYDPAPGHLDAVASLDSDGHFFWVSLRSIPNLYTGNYLSGNVTDISPVYGTCNVLTPGWIIMDAAIDPGGDLLFYSNGYFGPTYTECVGVPCEAMLGIAQKVNDSTFDKTAYSDAVLENVNDTAYLVYAPQVSGDGLELYFTRLLKTGFDTEICVAVRSTVADAFSEPAVLYSNYGFFPEAATLSNDKQRLYYHQKNEAGVYAVYMRYREPATYAEESGNNISWALYPNPAKDVLQVALPDASAPFIIVIRSAAGQEVWKVSNSSSINISHLASGRYYLTVYQHGRTGTKEFIID